MNEIGAFCSNEKESVPGIALGSPISSSQNTVFPDSSDSLFDSKPWVFCNAFATVAFF